MKKLYYFAILILSILTTGCQQNHQSNKENDQKANLGNDKLLGASEITTENNESPKLVKKAYETRGYIMIDYDCYEQWCKGKQITTSGRCFGPILSPDNRYVAYIKETPNITVNTAEGDVTANEIWIYDVKSDKHTLLLRGRYDGDVQKAIGDIRNLRYSLDGNTISFYSSCYTTSGAIQSVDIKTKKVNYIIDGNAHDIIKRGKYAGNLYVYRRVYLHGPDGGTEFSNWVITKKGIPIKRICNQETEPKVCGQFEKEYIE